MAVARLHLLLNFDDSLDLHNLLNLNHVLDDLDLEDEAEGEGERQR